MRYLILMLFACSLFTARAQDAEFYYKQGMEKAQTGDLEKALQLLDKSISLNDHEYVAWYNRAIVKSMMGRYEDALPDLEQTIKLNPGYKKAYLNRGTAKKHLTDYAGAIADYTYASQLDSTYAEAYYNLGLVYQLFEKKSLACTNFTKATQLGYKTPLQKIGYCNDTSTKKDIHTIMWLTETTPDIKYGFSPDRPVKVGTGYDGGPANQRAYLDLLRDAKGNPVKYTRIESCCAYPSPNALKGLALLDKYEVTFRNENNEEKVVMVYLTFYDYEAPQVLNGFRTVRKY